MYIICATPARQSTILLDTFLEVNARVCEKKTGKRKHIMQMNAERKRTLPLFCGVCRQIFAHIMSKLDPIARVCGHVWCGVVLRACVARADNSCTVDLPACWLGKLSASHMPSADHHHHLQQQQQQQQHCCYQLCNANALPDTISALFGP